MNIKFVDLNAIDWTEKRVTRFWSRVDKKPGDGCWEWTGWKQNYGYGMFSVISQDSRRCLLAHRVSMHLHGIELPDGKVCDHLCRNRKCVRPSHIRLVTQEENVLADGSLCLTKKKADQVRCSRGHEFSVVPSHESNRKPKRRRCLACRRDSDRARYAAKAGGG